MVMPYGEKQRRERRKEEAQMKIVEINAAIPHPALLDAAQDEICAICNTLISEHGVDHRSVVGMLRSIMVIDVDVNEEEL